MAFIVYVYKSAAVVPYMEVLPQTDREDARGRALAILKQHRAAAMVELWEDEQLLEKLEPEAAR